MSDVELMSGEGFGDGGDMTGEMYIPSEHTQDEEDEGTLDESVFKTLVGWSIFKYETQPLQL